MMAMFLPVLWFLTIFAHDIISTIFDPRYEGAAWILQIYALAYIPAVISGLGPFYMLLDNNKLLATLSFVKTLTFFIVVLIGWYFKAGNGIILGVCLYNSAIYLVELYAQIKYKLWLPVVDFVGFASSILIIWIGLKSTNQIESFIANFI
jgi:O-antigen/teichoic acid export membrane protein